MPTTKQSVSAEIAALGRKHPDVWCEKILGVNLTEQQKFLLRELFVHRRIHLRSCHATGKSFALACGVLCFGTCYSPCTIVTTAAGGRQVKRQLWAEIPRLYHGARVQLPGHMMTTEWVISRSQGGSKPSNAVGYSTNEPGRFTGEHNEHFLVVIDEGHNVDSAILTAVKTSMQAANSHMAFAGNPVKPEGAFYEEYRRPTWRKIKFDAFKHPNIVEQREVIKGAVTQEWIDEIRNDYGESSPEYIGRVLGEFPKTSQFGVFQLGDIIAAEKRWEPDYPKRGALKLGVDVAWQGDDRTVLMIRDSNAVRFIQAAQKQDPLWTADQAARLIEDWNIEPENTFIDITGIGSGTVAALDRKGLNVNGVNFGGGAYDNETYANVRAEMYFEAAKALRRDEDGGPSKFAFEPHTSLGEELRYVPYTYSTDKKPGRYLILKKDKIKKLLRRSPDFADAFALTFVVGGKSWFF